MLRNLLIGVVLVQLGVVRTGLADSPETTAPQTIVQRWPTWLPWTIAGSSVLFVGTGLAFDSFSDDNIDRYDREVREHCPEACSPSDIPASVKDLKIRADRQDTAAMGLWIAGGASLAVGLTMLWFNAPRIKKQDQAGIHFLPVGPEGKPGVSATYELYF